ncbi:hypothetical protein SCUCBS95973_008688 [Sporothrix curviconia]|uniref:Uncharacterized protein n=1 Tax=Sporothrix curviconia TaxID=1260050 RepID=A0ABP0CP88_9PEZI
MVSTVFIPQITQGVSQMDLGSKSKTKRFSGSLRRLHARTRAQLKAAFGAGEAISAEQAAVEQP